MSTTPYFEWPQHATNETGWGAAMDAMILQQEGFFRNIGLDITAPPYSAVANNGSDSATAIQAALDAAGAAVGNTQGGVVFVPKGEFTVQSQIQVPNMVRLVGVGGRASRIKAGASFPTSTPIVRLGKSSDSTIYATSVEYLRIDANNIVGSTCLYSNSGNEKSGAYFCNLSNFRAYGIEYTGGASYAHVRDCELGGSSSGSTTGIWTHATAGPTIIDGEITINNSGAGQTATDGVLASSMCVVAGILHVEHAVNAISFTGGSGGTINFMQGHSTLTNLLNIGPSFSGCLSTRTLINASAGQVLVNDQPKGTTIVGSQMTQWMMNGAARSTF